MKRFLMLAVVFVLFGQVLMAQDNSDVFRSPLVTSQRDPFELDLENYYYWRNTGGTTLGLGITGFVAATISGSYFVTAQATGWTPASVGQIGAITSYAIVGVTAVATVVGFWLWYDNSNKYMDTLRLQTRYNNAVSQ